MIFFILLLCVILPRDIFAAPQVSITNYPASVITGDIFSLTFNISAAEIGTTYHFKAVGDSNADISIFPACASRYDDCLNIVISDIATNSATASLKINQAQGVNNIKIRIAQSDKHASTYDSSFVSILSLTATPSATPSAIPTTIPTTIYTATPSATPILSPTAIPSPTISYSSLSINELMANPETNQSEWIEIHNASTSSILVSDLCFYDAAHHSRCLPKDLTIEPSAYYSHSFSSGFLNNDGDTIYFLDSVITYPKSPQNYSYSRQNNDSWCFAYPSLNGANTECFVVSSASTDSSKSSEPLLPKLNLESTLSPVFPGQKIILNFKLESTDKYLLRLESPFGNRYEAFGDYQDAHRSLSMELVIPKTLAPGTYPLQFHLKKDGSSHLFDYQFGNLVVVKKIIPKTIVSKNTVLGVSISSPPIATCSSVSGLSPQKADTNVFYWPIFFLGSILFLSPTIFPKIYSA